MTDKRKRLGTIAALMVLSFFMLLGFTARWLYVQYGEERASLQSSLSSSYNNRMQYHFDQAFVAQYLSKDGTVDSSHLYGTQHHFIVLPKRRSDSNNYKAEQWDDRIKKLLLSHNSSNTLKAMDKISRIYISDSTTLQSDSSPKSTVQKQIMQSSIEINISNNEGNALTNTTIQALNPSSIIDTGHIKTAILNVVSGFGKKIFKLKIDTLSFKKDMDYVMRSQYSGLHYRYAKATKNEIAVVVPNDNDSVYFSVGNYKWYVFKKMAAQIGFCIAMLLLCGLAFVLSFFTVRQQMQLSEQKNDFISNMSHELKTPVTTAQLALESFNHFDIADNPQKTKEYLQIASWEMKRLEMLVANVLNNSRLEEGRISFQKELLNMNDLLFQITQQFSTICREQGKHLTFENSLVNLSCFGDKLHLQGALYNVIDNAIKYGRSKVIVSLSDTSNQIHVIISDDGSGIPPEYRHKIFEKFFRIPTGNEHLVKGYGLGLHYAKYVIEQHKGKIVVDISQFGGTSISIILPKAEQHEC